MMQNPFIYRHLRGLILEDTPLANPVTGQRIPLQRQHLTFMDPHSGGVFILRRAPVIQCCMGDVIRDGHSLAFCRACGQPVCARHSIQDPFCGYIFCLSHSRLIEVNGILLRVCTDCYRRIREGWLRRAVRLLVGKG